MARPRWYGRLVDTFEDFMDVLKLVFEPSNIHVPPPYLFYDLLDKKFKRIEKDINDLEIGSGIFVYFEEVDPTNDIGSNYDVWFNTESLEVFRKENDVWVKKMTLSEAFDFNLEIEVVNGFISYRIDDSNWIQIVDIDDISGEDGEDGLQVELSSNSTHLIWRYVGDVNWTNLIELSELKGEDGADGEELEIRVDGGYIQTRLGSGNWVNLIELSDLTGPGLPSGGTTGQLIKKTSNTNYDTEWVDDTELIIMHIDGPEDKTYPILITSDQSRIITKTIATCEASTCNLTFKIGNTAIGQGVHAVSTSVSSVNRTSDNEYGSGDRLFVEVANTDNNGILSITIETKQSN
jgi:hypothetical protein